MDKISIFWFRRDLRLHDNVALFNALKSVEKVLPIFIFDTSILEKLSKNDARVSFIIKELRSMNEHLKSFDASINIYHGKPIEIFESLIKKYPIASVFTNHDYEPYAIKRDQEIKELLISENINFNSFKDQVIFEKNEITKKDGNPYVVYTPYSKKWIEAYEQINHTHYTSEDLLSQLYTQSKAKELTLEELGFEETNTPIKNYIFNSRIINEYEETRNFPALDNTSKLGPHLRFGTVSVRQMVSRAEEQEKQNFSQRINMERVLYANIMAFPSHTQRFI